MPYPAICRLIAAMLAVSLVTQPQALIILPLFEQGGVGVLYGAMIAAVVAAALVSIAGLWHCRWWGFLAFYGYAIAATILLGVALIPFVIALAPASARVAGVIAINVGALLLVGFVQWRHRRAAGHRA